MTATKLPKRIWFLWFQGEKEMPELVRKCYQSWQQYNPNWQLTLLDDNNLDDFIEVMPILANRKVKLYRAAQSDFIRINLLNKYGGVWVDATCICQQPLDDWLFDYMDSGFFAFHRPGRDRMLSSWFLAAVEGNELVSSYCEAVNEFWLKHKNIYLCPDRPFIYQGMRMLKIYRYLKKHPVLWYHPIMTKGLKVYPYFWFFYLFEKLYQEKPAFRKIWDQTPKFSADIPHKIWHHGLFKPLSPALKKDIDDGADPLYKLTYKYAPEQVRPGSALGYLLNKRASIKSDAY